MLKYSLMALLALVIFVPKAHADILIEPYARYELGGSFNTTDSSNTGNNWSQRGLGFGGRLGYQGTLLFVAADYAITPNGTLSAQSSGYPSPSMSESQLFLDVGLRLLLFRVYGGYGFMNDLTAKFTGGDQTYKGTGWKLGASFTGIPFVDINFEYINSSYNASGTKISDNNQTLTNLNSASGSEYVVSLSVPFAL